LELGRSTRVFKIFIKNWFRNFNKDQNIFIIKVLNLIPAVFAQKSISQQINNNYISAEYIVTVIAPRPKWPKVSIKQTVLACTFCVENQCNKLFREKKFNTYLNQILD